MTNKRPRTSHLEDFDLVSAHLATRSNGAAGAEVADRLALRLAAIPKFLTVINRRRGGRLTPDAVDDLSQDVLLEVLGKLSTYRGEASLESWLYQIATRRYSNRLRDLARQKESLDDYAARRRESGPLESIPLHWQISAELPRSTGLLSPENRAVLEAKWLRGLTFREIARELGASTNTMKTRYYRSLNLLASSLGLTSPK